MHNPHEPQTLASALWLDGFDYAGDEPAKPIIASTGVGRATAVETPSAKVPANCCPTLAE